MKLISVQEIIDTNKSYGVKHKTGVVWLLKSQVTVVKKPLDHFTYYYIDIPDWLFNKYTILNKFRVPEVIV